MSELKPFTPDVDAADPLADYRPISPLAIVALLAGLSSSLAFADPLLLFVPVASAVLAGIALSRFRHSRIPMLGRSAAVLGLMFSVLFGSWAAVGTWTRQRVLLREAEGIGRQWLELVRDGKFYEAHQLHLSQRDRAAPDKPLDKFYREKKPMDIAAHTNLTTELMTSRDVFLGSELRQLDRQATFRLLDHESRRVGKEDEVTQHYVVESDLNGQHKILNVELILKRTGFSYVRESQWLIDRVSTKVVR